jgi:uncharacterized membrane protein
MKHKLSLDVNKKDVRVLINNVINLSLNRLSVEYQKETAKLGSVLASGNSVEILEELDNLVSSIRKCIQELEDHSSLVEQIDIAEAEEEEEAKTEEESNEEESAPKKKPRKSRSAK